MRIGSVRISGVSPRFFILLGVCALAVIAIMVFKPSSPTYNAAVDPAFPSCPEVGSCDAQVKKTLQSKQLQNSGWVGQFVSAYGLQRPTLKSQLVADYVANAGLPMRFKVYVPDLESQQERRDLTTQKFGYQFLPATFVAPEEATGLDELAQRAAEDIADQPLQLGFRQAKTPTPGQAYEVTALLWWRSDQLSPPDTNDPNYDPENLPLPSPVLLVDSYERLSASELRAPATQRVDLDLVYQEDDLEVRLSSLEWSAGRELRACVTISNTSTGTVPMWEGVSAMTADVGEGSATGAPDETSALAQAGELEAQQNVPGFITFDDTVANPEAPLTLRMPALSPDAGEGVNTLVVRVPTENIENVSDSQGKSSSCGAGTATSDGGSNPFQALPENPGSVDDEPTDPGPASSAPGAEGAEGDGSTGVVPDGANPDSSADIQRQLEEQGSQDLLP